MAFINKSNTSNEAGWGALANAIVIRAVQDYYDDIVHISYLQEKPHTWEIMDAIRRRKDDMKNIEKFMHSQYYMLLTSVDGQTLLDEAQRQAKNDIEKGVSPKKDETSTGKEDCQSTVMLTYHYDKDEQLTYNFA